MPATSKGRKRGGLHRRRIIERPRLLALLNGSPARVRTLIAPAGYGKTTLAEQWVGQEGRRHAWFTARPSSTDVAALALGLARAATAIVPDCDVRLREHLRALPAPAEHVDVLAELLGEDLAEWPEDGWMIFDDYHELGSSPEAESFVQELVAESPVQLLIASRQRPSWITARTILYGEVLELNQTELAMDGHEAAEVLTERNAASASGLVALADGWPAVIGLASVSEAELDEAGAVPDALYEFFAEEVFGSLSIDVQAGLKTLAIAPVLDRTLVQELLGKNCDRVCVAALDTGILVERGTRFEIHPLARAFLENQLQHDGAADNHNVARCISYFRQRKDWDAAFDLIVRHGCDGELERLLEDALDELLETARLSTVESWCRHASTIGFEAPVLRLARAEVALRYGRLAEAQTHAEAAAAETSGITVRALITAGRAAHVASLDVEALELFRHAEAAATDEASRREARWGQALCYSDLELPEGISVLEELATDVRDAREAVRAAGYQLSANLISGALDLTAADRAAQLLPAVRDPLVESGFLSVYSSSLATAARYPEARDAAMALLTVAQTYRLDFALPYVRNASGLAEAGLRNWDAAERTLHEGIAEARRSLNSHGEQACLGALLRTLAQRRRFDAALRLVREHGSRPSQRVTPAQHVEFVASHAFVLAAADQLDEACGLIHAVRGLSHSSDSAALVSLVRAIVVLKQHRADGIDLVVGVAQRLFSVGALDYLVTAYRAIPEVLAVLLRSSEAARVQELMVRVGDADLADAVGSPIVADADPTVLLTRREAEVHELLREGLSNRQIASLLVISEATAKRHVQHIFDKLGVRSRRAIALQAALERSATQATSAIDETGAGSDS
jgi:LuxR family transcriptional regulator, maltose regulon positive regulatory protein